MSRARVQRARRARAGASARAWAGALALAAVLGLLALRAASRAEQVVPVAPVAPASASAPPSTARAALVPEAGERAATFGAREALAPVPAGPPALADGGWSVRGRVLDDARAPLEGAWIVLAEERVLAELALEPSEAELAALCATRSAADGGFALSRACAGCAGELAGLGSRAWRVRVGAPGFASLERSLPGPAAELGALVLERAASLSGRVVDEQGAPVADAELFVLVPALVTRGREGSLRGLRAARSDALGRFALGGLAPGPWAVSVRASAHPALLARGATRAGERQGGLELVLERGLELRGRVEGEGRAREGDALRVRALPLDSAPGFVALDPTRAATDARLAHEPARFAALAPDGTFVLRGLRESARYRIEVVRAPESAIGFADALAPLASEAVEWTAGAAGREELVLALHAERFLSLRAVDARSGESVERFELRWGSSHLAPALDAEGRVRTVFAEGRARLPLRALAREGEPLRLRIDAPGHRAYERDGLLLPARGDLDLGALRLEPQR